MNSKLLKVLFESALFAAGSFPALCADAQTVEEEQSRLDDTLHHPWKFKFGAAIMSNSNSQCFSWKSGMDSAIVVVIVVVSIVSGLRCKREHKNILCCLRCHVEVPTLMTSSSSTVRKFTVVVNVLPVEFMFMNSVESLHLPWKTLGCCNRSALYSWGQFYISSDEGGPGSARILCAFRLTSIL